MRTAARRSSAAGLPIPRCPLWLQRSRLSCFASAQVASLRRRPSEHLAAATSTCRSSSLSSFRCFSSNGTGRPLPPFVQRRLRLWQEEQARQQHAETRDAVAATAITITLPDGSRLECPSGTTALDVAAGLSTGLAREVVVARVNGQLRDLTRALDEDCSLELLKFDSKEGKQVFWHSSSHILGQALEQHYYTPEAKEGEEEKTNIQLCDGPALDEDKGGGGFFYEFLLAKKIKGEGTSVSSEEFGDLEKRMQEILKSKQLFERMKVSKEFALKMFTYNKFKRELIESLPEGEEITLYRCGDFVDLCRGPHIPHTGMIKAFSVLKASGAYWKGDAQNELLQRVYAISFPKATQLKEWTTMREEAMKRDHRLLIKNQNLVMFSPLSPGSPFFLPHGTRIYNRLVNFLRDEYRKRGYEEVITPLVFHKELWETSGHWQNYKDDMFIVSSPHHGQSHGSHDHNQNPENKEDTIMGLKPMNCPGHCLIFANEARSYRDLPVRFADFGVLHRNELSGTLTGLTRVRRFQQDDAHIFCTEEQMESEIMACLEFMQHVYSVFGFELFLSLSTRPTDKYLGDLSLWDKAENALRRCLDRITSTSASSQDKGERGWKVAPGEGAFYGPKIDVQVSDSLGRRHQCATIQLDFNLPHRFGLSYATKQGSLERPVLIHRAIFGSIERMIGILTEHVAGKWPFWLNPRQVLVVPIRSDSEKQVEYARRVWRRLQREGYHVDLEDSERTSFAKKIKEGQSLQYNFMLVVGEEEADSYKKGARVWREKSEGEEAREGEEGAEGGAEENVVSVRTRDNVVHGKKPLADLLSELATLQRTFQ
ncbi:Threonine--tRNA ligase 2, cytoplasmic [Balamuthia mandrillaris]